jgi:hypothetical protein
LALLRLKGPSQAKLSAIGDVGHTDYLTYRDDGQEDIIEGQ